MGAPVASPVLQAAWARQGQKAAEAEPPRRIVQGSGGAEASGGGLRTDLQHKRSMAGGGADLMRPRRATSRPLAAPPLKLLVTHPRVPILVGTLAWLPGRPGREEAA